MGMECCRPFRHIATVNPPYFSHTAFATSALSLARFFAFVDGAMASLTGDRAWSVSVLSLDKQTMQQQQQQQQLSIANEVGPGTTTAMKPSFWALFDSNRRVARD